jgi:CDP-diacylglycerol--glycerol-3-phosphate 3-phosphatidyltransferase
MFPRSFQKWARGIAEGIVMPLARRGVTPNAITISGFAFNIVTAIVLASGHLSSGGTLLFLSGLFDMLDGALARVARKQSTFGAFLDSLLDRLSEALILLALIYVFTQRGNTAAVVLVYSVAIGSILISYARARAEGLGLSASVGIAPRPERVFILGLGLLFNPTTTIIALAALAVLTQITLAQRLFHVWRVTRVDRPDEKQQQKSEAKHPAVHPEAKHPAVHPQEPSAS